MGYFIVGFIVVFIGYTLAVGIGLGIIAYRQLKGRPVITRTLRSVSVWDELDVLNNNVSMKIRG